MHLMAVCIGGVVRHLLTMTVFLCAESSNSLLKTALETFLAYLKML